MGSSVQIFEQFCPKARNANSLDAEAKHILERDYKIRPDSDHVAKFQGDWSRDLGELVAKKRYITGKTQALPSGGLTRRAWQSQT